MDVRRCHEVSRKDHPTPKTVKPTSRPKSALNPSISEGFFSVWQEATEVAPSHGLRAAQLLATILRPELLDFRYFLGLGIKQSVVPFLGQSTR